MTTYTANRNYPKEQGTDNWKTALKTTIPAAIDLIDTDVAALLTADTTETNARAAADTAMTAALATSLLVNGGFEVFQRGGTVTADLAYAHDRWQLDLVGSSTCTITDDISIVDAGSGHSLKAVYVQGSAASFVDQKLEDYRQLRGKTVTFAVRVVKGVASSVRPYIQDSGTRTYGATSATVGSFTTMTVTLAIGAAATSVTVGVELSISDTVYLDNATLCLGSVAGLYTPLHPADDLRRCQRYYWEVGGLLATEFVTAMQAQSATAADGVMTFPVEMAATPTVTVSAAADWRVLTAAGTGAACTALSTTATRRNCRFSATVASGLVAGNASILSANSTTNARIKFEANI